jgi:hypothetical protein
MGGHYEVGYGKPPKETRFRPGQSGNPKGRPKGAQNLTTDVKEELEEKIVVTEGGRPRPMTKQRAMIKSLMAKALKGDSRAVHVLVGLKLGLDQAEGAKPDEELLTEEDREVLARFEHRVLDRHRTRDRTRGGEAP